MQISNLFKQDIRRSINGVVKADQKDDAVVWQELEEYVLTKEVRGHLMRFFEQYLATIDQPQDRAITDRMGVWVSGFFGSGKSHFIKILSYLFGNQPVTSAGKTRTAIEFFKAKVEPYDPSMFGDIKRAVSVPTDTILFNIDSKADNKESKQVILKVFLKVFNELQGFCGENAHVARLEQQLIRKGKYEDFKRRFTEVNGGVWEEERDTFDFIKDEVKELIRDALDMSEAAIDDWLEKTEDNYDVSPEAFAKLVKVYLDNKGPNHRLMFLVDEVGQFIGSNSDLMLNLQTITEDLGRICHGRAWVIVTSQEDIDIILGEVKSSKANDFSKIQGRFTTRLSLSSANTDEVIQLRILDKTDDALPTMEHLYSNKGEILNSQVSFRGGKTLRAVKSPQEFANLYPFLPYQFELVQKIFEAVRKSGATGLHIGRGERSMLEAFQSAAKRVADFDIGVLIPLYEFYPSIESFLDTYVKMTIQQSEDNTALNDFDRQLLKVLFLIRYVEEEVIPPTQDNITSLMVDKIDTDRLELKHQIGDSLKKLEQENLIRSSGDRFYFLTNEEQDVNREIRKVDIEPAKEREELSRLIYDEILDDLKKYRHSNGVDYAFNRFLDGRSLDRYIQSDITMEILTSLNEQYDSFSDGDCIFKSGEDSGKVVVKLPYDKPVFQELTKYLQIETYIAKKLDASATSSLKTILSNRKEENRKRRGTIREKLAVLLVQSDCYIAGKKVAPETGDPKKWATSLINTYLVNVYRKLSYLKIYSRNIQNDILTTLNIDDIGQLKLNISRTDCNPEMIKEITGHIDLASQKTNQLTIDDLVEYFNKRPFGWPQQEVMLQLVRLRKIGEILFEKNDQPLEGRELSDALLKSNNWKSVIVRKKKTLEKAILDQAKNLYNKLFSKIASDNEENFAEEITLHLNQKIQELDKIRHYTDTDRYPGKREVNEGLILLRELVSGKDSTSLLELFVKKKDGLLDLVDDLLDMKDFYTNQRQVWEEMLRKCDGIYKENRNTLEISPDAHNALNEIFAIKEMSTPYSRIKDLPGLMQTVDRFYNEMLENQRKLILTTVDTEIGKIKVELENKQADGEICNKVLYPLQQHRKRIEAETSAVQLNVHERAIADKIEAALDLLEELARPKQPDKPGTPPPPPRPRVETISSSRFMKKPYLENENDVEDYITTLKEGLLAMVREQKRVRIK